MVFLKLLFTVLIISNIKNYYVYCCDKTTFHNTQIKLSTNQQLSKYQIVTGCLSPTPSFHLPEEVNTIECCNQDVPIFYEKAVANINVKILKFLNNQIEQIKSNAFYNLTQLWSLEITDNDIQVIESDAFVNLPKLIFLDLRKNKLKYLEHGSFANIPLQELALSNNELEAFEPEWFNEQSNLITLHLDYNRIRSIQKNTFLGFAKLNCISAGHNHIYRIHRDAFKGMNYLESLRLSHNRIKKFEKGTFKSPELHQLWLHGNNLTYLSKETLNEISEFSKYYEISLTLHINPWQCACYDNIIEWCAKNSINLQTRAECRNQDSPVCIFQDENGGKCTEEPEEDINKYFYEKYDFNANQMCTDKIFKCSWDHINNT